MAKKLSGIQKPMDYSEEMQEILDANGYKKQNISRAEATKQIWVYIKSEELQDENDGRVINPDSILSGVLGKKSLKMTQIAKKLSDHLFPLD